MSGCSGLNHSSYSNLEHELLASCFALVSKVVVASLEQLCDLRTSGELRCMKPLMGCKRTKGENSSFEQFLQYQVKHFLS